MVTEVGGDFVNLSWEKPENDGGSRIQGYWIEKREADSETWQRVNASLCVPTQINISNLIEDRQYEFRVFAQNAAGLSNPSYAANLVKIKDPLGNIMKYRISKSSLSFEKSRSSKLSELIHFMNAKLSNKSIFAANFEIFLNYNFFFCSCHASRHHKTAQELQRDRESQRSVPVYHHWCP